MRAFSCTFGIFIYTCRCKGTRIATVCHTAAMTQAAAKRCMQTGGLMQRPAVNWVGDVCLSPQDKFVIHHPAPCLSHSARPSVRLAWSEHASKSASSPPTFESSSRRAPHQSVIRQPETGLFSFFFPPSEWPPIQRELWVLVTSATTKVSEQKLLKPLRSKRWMNPGD